MTKATTKTVRVDKMPLFEGKANRAELFRQAIEEEVALLKAKKESTNKIDHKKIVLIVQTRMSKYPPNQRVPVELLESYRAWSYYRQKQGHPRGAAGRPKKSDSMPETASASTPEPSTPSTGPRGAPPIMERVPGEMVNGEPGFTTTTPIVTPTTHATGQQPMPQSRADDTQSTGVAPQSRSEEGSVVFLPESLVAGGDGRMAGTVGGSPIPPVEGYHAFSSRELKAALALLRIFNWDMERAQVVLDLVGDFREEVGRG